MTNLVLRVAREAEHDSLPRSFIPKRSMFMRTMPKFFILVFAVNLLTGAGPSWKDKPITQWDEQDAKQFLVDSPWIKYSKPAALPAQNEFQRRDGGVMGGGQNGIGIEALRELNAIGLGGGAKQEDRFLRLPAVPIRWESASPVRAAEEKIGAPTWETADYY